jgi:3'(2'), 5'-bisphosphate nucleotidase
MLEKELESAIEAAREAARTVLEYYGRDVVAQQKIGVDNHAEPVTIADKAASRIIVSRLTEAFPEDYILSEEEIDHPKMRTENERVWMIDPIDGTWGFIKKDGDFAVQIGLVENGDPILGVVLVPVLDLLYYAVKGEGAFAMADGGEAVRLKTSDNADFSRMSLAVSRNHRSPKISRIITDFGLKQEIQRGSVGLKVGLIADKICDLYIHLSPRTKFWDTCGPQIILEEAGGKLTDLFGERIRYDIKDVQNHGGIVASNGVAHAAAIAKLRPLLTEFGRLKIKASGGK